jgi:uncharacterized protein DUF397
VLDHEPAELGAEVLWRKSTFSNPSGECVELACLSSRRVAVRDSTDPDGPRLVFAAAEMAAFVDGVKAGEFDRDRSTTTAGVLGRPEN